MLVSKAVLGWLLVLVLTPGRSGAQVPDPRGVIALASSVLAVESLRARGGYALGSAVVVGDGLVVTNCHVTREARAIDVVRGGLRWSVSAQRSDAAHDLCLLQVPGLQAPPARFGRADALHVGEPLSALGYTGGVRIQVSAGEVVELHRFDGGQVIQASSEFSSGASGGGLFDGSGRLVGVLTFKLRGADQHYFAVPVEWVRRLVDDGAEGFRAVAPLTDAPLPYWQASEPAQPNFLRAVAMAHDSRWADLVTLGEAWVRSEPDEAEAWERLGGALMELDRAGPAREALECALRLDPARAGARSRLQGLAAGPSAPALGLRCPAASAAPEGR